MAEEHQLVETYSDMPVYQLSKCGVILLLLVHKNWSRSISIPSLQKCGMIRLTSLILWLCGQPSSQHVISVIMLIRHEQHATATDSCWRGILQAVTFKDEIDIVGKLNSLSTWHGQQPANTINTDCGLLVPLQCCQSMFCSECSSSANQSKTDQLHCCCSLDQTEASKYCRSACH